MRNEMNARGAARGQMSVKPWQPGLETADRPAVSPTLHIRSSRSIFQLCVFPWLAAPMQRNPVFPHPAPQLPQTLLPRPFAQVVGFLQRFPPGAFRSLHLPFSALDRLAHPARGGGARATQL